MIPKPTLTIPPKQNILQSNSTSFLPSPRSAGTPPSSSKITPQSLSQKNSEFEDNLSMILLSNPRTEAQAKILFSVIKHFSFFRTLCHLVEDNLSYQQEAFLEVIQTMKYVQVPQGKVIFKQFQSSEKEMYVVYSGEVGIIVHERDIITKQNIKKLEAFKQMMLTSERTMQKGLSKEYDLVQMNQIESYIVSNKVSHIRKRLSDDSPRISLSMLLKGYGRFQELIHKYSMIVKAYILFKRSFKRRQKVKRIAAKYGIMRDRIYQGGYFGEAGLLEEKEHEETALALTDCKLFVIKSGDFQELWKDFISTRMQIQRFIFESFPKLYTFKSPNIIDSLTHVMEEQRYNLNNRIVTEGANGEYFYLVYSGKCEVYKEAVLDDNTEKEKDPLRKRSFLRSHGASKKKIAISTISTGVFFGEEVLFSQDRKYQMSVRAISSKMIVLAFDIHRFAARYPKEVYEAIKEAFHNKEKRHMKALKALVLSAFEEYELAAQEANDTIEKNNTPRDSARILKTTLKLQKKKTKGFAPPSLIMEDQSVHISSLQNIFPNKMALPSARREPTIAAPTFKDLESDPFLPYHGPQHPSSSQGFFFGRKPSVGQGGAFSPQTTLTKKFFPSQNVSPSQKMTASQPSSPPADAFPKIYGSLSLYPTQSSKNAITESGKEDYDIYLRRTASQQQETIANLSTVNYTTSQPISPSNIAMIKKMIHPKIQPMDFVDKAEISLSPNSTRKNLTTGKKDKNEPVFVFDKNNVQSFKFDMGKTPPSKIKYWDKRRGITMNSSRPMDSGRKAKEEIMESPVNHKKTKSDLFKSIVSTPSNQDSKDGSQIAKFQKNVKKLQRIHLHTRSSNITQRDEEEMERVATQPNEARRENLSTAVADFALRNVASEIVVKKKYSLTPLYSMSPRCKTGDFHKVPALHLGALASGKQIEQEKETVQKERHYSIGNIVKPIIFPMKIKKVQKEKVSNSSLPTPQDETTANTTSPTNLACSMKMGSFFGGSDIQSSRSFSMIHKVDDSRVIPKELKKSQEGKEFRALGGVATESLFGRQKSMKGVRKGKECKEKMEVAMAKIQVYLEEIPDTNGPYKLHSYR